MEYSLNGKEWTTEASEGFAYVRVINPTAEKISVSGTITLTNDQPDAAATTNMITYSNYAIGNVVDGDKATKFWKGANQAAGDYIQIEYAKTFDLHNLNFYFISSNGTPSDAPQEAIVEVSADGSEWHPAGTIHISDLTADMDGLCSYTINGIDQQVRYVCYRVTSPTSNVWFQLAEVTVNEGIELPQATVSGKTMENVGDGDVTTYSVLTAGEELHYQVIENADVSEISVLALSDLSEELNAQVFIYASKTNYPYQNEWIELGTLNGSHTAFDVSAYDNLQQIVIANQGEGLNVFEISVSGDAYIDDAKLNALVDTAIDRLTKLQGMDASGNTLSSVKRFEEELLAVQEALHDYENETDVQAILTMLEESTQLLVEKGDSEELESV